MALANRTLSLDGQLVKWKGKERTCDVSILQSSLSSFTSDSLSKQPASHPKGKRGDHSRQQWLSLTRQFQFSKSPSGTHLAARTTFHIQLPRSRTVFLLESYKVMSSGREEGGERHNQGHMRRLTLPSRSTHLMLCRPSEIASNTIKLTYTTVISHSHRFQNYEENHPNF